MTSPQFQFGKSDGQHKKAAKVQPANLTITRGLTDPLKFNLHFGLNQEPSMSA
jgi:hypothetical protein